MTNPAQNRLNALLDQSLIQAADSEGPLMQIRQGHTIPGVADMPMESAPLSDESRLLLEPRSRDTARPPEPLRHRLPERRRSTNHTFVVDGRAYEVAFGLHEDGRVSEVFIDAPPSDQALAVELKEAAKLASYLLQVGVAPASIARLMERGPGADGRERPVSLLGMIWDKAVELDTLPQLAL